MNELPTWKQKHDRKYLEYTQNMETNSVCQSFSNARNNLKILTEFGF